MLDKTVGVRPPFIVGNNLMITPTND